jgi:hypothetical protein
MTRRAFEGNFSYFLFKLTEVFSENGKRMNLFTVLNIFRELIYF